MSRIRCNAGLGFHRPEFERVDDGVMKRTAEVRGMVEKEMEDDEIFFKR